MKLKFRLGVLAGLLLGSNVALADGKVYLSLGGGTADHDDTTLLIRSGENFATQIGLTSGNDESDLVSVSAGVADVSARFLIEYYHQSGELSGAAADYTKQGLFYSGYWTPNLYVPKLHGILGAGIGAAQIDLESDNAQIGGNFEDREFQYKFTAGIEYRLIDLVTIFGTYEQHYSRKFTHSDAQRQIQLHDSDQSVIQIGIAARF